MRADAVAAPALVIPQAPVGRRTPRRAVDTGPADYTRVKAAAAYIDEDNLAFVDALRNLLAAGLVTEQQLTEYPNALVPATIEEEKLLWKARWKNAQHADI